jgi:hypothetical protein
MLMRTDITNRRCDFARAVGDRTIAQRARKREGVAQLREGRRPASMRDRLNQWIFSDGADTHDHTLPSHSPTYGLAAPLAGSAKRSGSDSNIILILIV